jgi:hypothetical protein
MAEPVSENASSVRIFISYAREDAATSVKLYNALARLGLLPWLDSEDLLPGQNWKVEIKRAVERADYFLALLSTKSLTKRGFVQRELKFALEVLDEFPEGAVYVIPVRLDECEPSNSRLRDLHRVDMFPSFEEGLNRILRVVSPSTCPAPHRDVGLAAQVSAPRRRRLTDAEKMEQALPERLRLENIAKAPPANRPGLEQGRAMAVGAIEYQRKKDETIDWRQAIKKKYRSPPYRP